MNFLNMFSDEAPISNNGYRKQLYSDPSIMQGVAFLNNEKNITNELSNNLNLISQTDGSNLSSGQIINGKIYEGMEPTMSTSGAPQPTATAGTSTTSGSSATTTTTTLSPEDKFKTEVMDEIKDKDITFLKMSYEIVYDMYLGLLKEYQKDYGGGIASLQLANTGTSTTPGQRQISIDMVKNIENAIGIIGVEISQVVKSRSKANIESYYAIMDQIRDVKYNIIEANNEIEELTKKVDPISAVAEREETYLLSKRNYYVYILWFIIAAVVIYVTIVNMINPNASFNVLALCIIILVCIFIFIMYSNITGGWYNDIKNGISDISIPRIENKFGNMFNFDPLVSIKYTS